MVGCPWDWVLKDQPWTGCTAFTKAKEPNSQVPSSKIHSSLTQLQNLGCQAGQIILYHDLDLAQCSVPAQTTVASWKSFKLKRKVVGTLAAEGQALQSGIGAAHWHRLLFLEAFHGMMSADDWRREPCKLPFVDAIDSKSLYDAASKLPATTAYISDKRTTIDLAVIKSGAQQTAGTIRWIDTRAMIADPLTKHHPGHYLRHVLRTGYWSIVEEGTALQRKALERQECHQLFLVVGNRVSDRCELGLFLSNNKSNQHLPSVFDNEDSNRRLGSSCPSKTSDGLRASAATVSSRHTRDEVCRSCVIQVSRH